MSFYKISDLKLGDTVLAEDSNCIIADNFYNTCNVKNDSLFKSGRYKGTVEFIHPEGRFFVMKTIYGFRRSFLPTCIRKIIPQTHT